MHIINDLNVNVNVDVSVNFKVLKSTFCHLVDETELAQL
jgi:hypothetical protein